MLSSYEPSGLRSVGVACAATTAIAGAAVSVPLPKSSAMLTPRALASRHTTATVGLAWARSIWDSMDLETPARRDNSSIDKDLAWRSRANVSPTRGGSATGVLMARVVIKNIRYKR